MAGKAGVYLLSNMANRHGLITGATGTGKTVTLQNMAETFSQMGVPVFAADIKGDLSGLAAVGGNKESAVKRVDEYGLKARGFAFQAFPAQFWDISGEQGAPVRAVEARKGPPKAPRALGRMREASVRRPSPRTLMPPRRLRPPEPFSVRP